MTPEEVLSSLRQDRIAFVDFKFIDLPGTWHHITVPADEIGADVFKAGLPFDGSSLRGFRAIEESDMVLLPDARTAFIDPFMNQRTLSLTCDVLDPSLEPYRRDPRGVARRAEEFLRTSGLADQALFGPELEFFLFDAVAYDISPERSGFTIEAEESIWGSSVAGGAYRIRSKEGYSPVPPTDHLANLRSDIVTHLKESGMRVERHHHEVATAGQSEIGFAADTLMRTADNVLLFKYIVKNTARLHEKTATFMPKPLFGDNGSGMHTHQSLWKDGKPLFAEEGGYAGLSSLALSYLAGILAHAPALVALTNASMNSYRRLTPGFEAPVDLVFSKGNRSAAVRIPVAGTTAKTTRIEFRTPDSTSNPYLAFSAMAMAGLDGIRRGLDPVGMGFGPIDKNVYHLTPEERSQIRSVPGSLEEALRELEADHGFLTEGGVFDEDLIEDWVAFKTEAEVYPVKFRPTPMEFHLTFDI